MRFSLVSQSLFYIAAGINHFWHPGFYNRIMPDHYSHPQELVQLSGACELLGGVGLLLPATRRTSAAGIIAMLAVFLDVHQYMLRHSDKFPDIPRWALWGRFPLQGLLMAWAWQFAKKEPVGRLHS